MKDDILFTMAGAYRVPPIFSRTTESSLYIYERPNAGGKVSTLDHYFRRQHGQTQQYCVELGGWATKWSCIKSQPRETHLHVWINFVLWPSPLFKFVKKKIRRRKAFHFFVVTGITFCHNCWQKGSLCYNKITMLIVFVTLHTCKSCITSIHMNTMK